MDKNETFSISEHTQDSSLSNANTVYDPLEIPVTSISTSGYTQILIHLTGMSKKKM